ncbi:glycyl-radical enzyme activating protein [Pectinatus sottacetonis]|uniref:glycyl-radical enzyme activating protein n=1 Tax=Pectinatus sottacetonis TaxID=1002795 RepID=UPI0018C66940|nr:glycyl-radical enzyme activating protein [Pectinatus sottacetonis]
MKDKGLVFDIRRFSVHDGAGIRTTVFFKGCPLRCIWCQNPEGIAPKEKLVYFANTCILCGYCTKIKDSAVKLENGKIIFNERKVYNPIEYENICPSGALKMDSRWYDTVELAAIVKKDKIFFKYGGGVTVSGGEPFMQPEFLLLFLKKLKADNINTAVESSLFADAEKIKKAMPFIDTLFADFKIYDNDIHKQYTGMDNTIIKNNLEMLLHSEYKNNIIVRTPLIPQYTATENNLHQIAETITKWYPRVKYELLNYNPLAKAKYQHMDYEYCFKENPPLYTKEEMKYFYNIVRNAAVHIC